MKKILLLSIIICVLFLNSCNKQLNNINEDVAKDTSIDIMHDDVNGEDINQKKQRINAVFLEKPDTKLRDEQRPFEPTDIFQFWSYDFEKDEMPEETVKSHVNIYCPGFYNYNPSNNAVKYNQNVNTTKVLAEKGVRMMNWYPNHAYLYDYDSEYDSLYCTDLDGRVVVSDGDVTGGFNAVYCICKPNWQEFIVKLHINALKCGAESSVSDAWREMGVCFCDDCMEGFNNYLNNKYDKYQLHLLGIEDINEFRYDDFIRENYYEVYKERDNLSELPIEIPFSFDYLDFRQEAVTDFQKRLHNEIKRANEFYGTDMSLSANMADYLGSHITCATAVDYFAPETFLPYNPYPRAAIRYEFANAFDTIHYAMPNCVLCAPLMLSEDVTDTTKIYLAEAYAHGGFLQSPFLAPYKSVVGKSIADTHSVSQPDMDELYPYFDFIYNNGIFFEELYPMSELAILFSHQSHLNTFCAEDDFWFCGQSIIKNNIPLKIIASGDESLIEKQLSIDEFKGLKLLVLPNVSHLNEHDTAVLNQFMKNGGRILSINASEMRVDYENEKNYTVIDEYFDWNEDFDQYFTFYEPDNIDVLMNEIKRSLTLPYSVQDEQIILTQYFSTKYDGYLYHAVNYDYNMETHEVKNKQEIKLELLNDTPYDIGNLAVYYSTPESSKIELLDFEVIDDKIVITIPSIDAWATIMLGGQDEKRRGFLGQKF